MRKKILLLLAALCIIPALCLTALADNARFLEYTQNVPGGTVTYQSTIWDAGLESERWDGYWVVHSTSPGVTELTPLTYISYQEDGKDYSGPVMFSGISNDQIVNVVLPSGEGFTEIGVSAFKGCTNLKSITLSDTVTSIGMSAFQDCTSLTTINFPENSVTSIGTGAFSGCTSLTSITIPGSVTTLGGDNSTVYSSAFDDCPNLTTVVFQEGVQSIPDYTFYQCSNLTTVVIPSTVKEIGERAFSQCKSLTSIAITPGVTKIGESAFDSCDALTDVYLPNTLKEIGKGAFWGCTALKELALPDGLTTLGENCFIHTGLTSLVIPGSVKSVDKICTDIASLAFCEGVTSITGMNDAKSLTTLTLPSSLQELDAFSDCYGLTDVYYSGSEAQWGGIKISERCYRWGYIAEGQIEKATLHYNASPAQLPALPEQPKQPAAPSAPPAAPSVPATASTAYAATQNVSVDGTAVSFQCYALKDEKGNAANYIKIRDLADILNGTAAQFQVGWADGVVTLTSGSSYTPNGSEQNTPFSGDRTYQKVDAATMVNGKSLNLEAFTLLDDNGGGYTYYKLRDLGQALGFNVGWSQERGIYLETNKPYNPND